MIRVPVESSNIATIGFNRATRRLEIEFRSGAVYAYSDVSPKVHEDLMAADSKGAFFAAHIKPSHAFEKMSSPAAAGGTEHVG